jgi:hypothetical protein
MAMMNADPVRVLELLSQIGRHQIQLDCAAASRSIRRWLKEGLLADGRCLSDSDPVVVADYIHGRLCRAWALSIRNVPKELRLYMAAVAADQVGGLAVEAALATPGHHLAAINGRIEAIRAREGLADDEVFGDDEPLDHQQAMAEFNQTCEAIHDDATAAVLRRYGMGAVGKLYRTNRERYDELLEQGRRRLFCGSQST